MTSFEKKKFYSDTLSAETAVMAYLDLSNIFHWQEKIGWNFRLEDMIRQLLAIPSMKEVKVYYGLDERKFKESFAFHRRIRAAGAILRTKPVKYIKKTINEALFFKQSTISLFSGNVTSKIYELIKELKKSGIIIEEPKCNFDVEIAMDMIDDTERISAALLYSGDSDLAAPLQRLKLKGKKVYVVGVRGSISGELQKVKDHYIDFGQFYEGKKRYLKP